MNESCVIYKIKNKINEKLYIGSTLKTFSKRISTHVNNLNKINIVINIFNQLGNYMVPIHLNFL